MLPIEALSEELLKAILMNPVTIVVGETGSGKTTHLPIILHQSGYFKEGMIGVAEPRRLAAISVARHVARKLNRPIGNLVGYSVRFDSRMQENVAIKFMTDGILVRNIQQDRKLSQYSAIIVDEAHERSINIDILLPLLRTILDRRTDLRVVIASATLNADKFSSYFGNAPIVEIPGRSFPISIQHSHCDFTVQEMPFAIAEKIALIHNDYGPGDILAFVAGKEDIQQVLCELERQEQELKNAVFLPVHGDLSRTEQDQIFASHPGKRKVIIATNIAETSLTIDGVNYVIDSGFINQTSFHPSINLESLDLRSHSQSGCNQRAGRAGRVSPGICFRMFTMENFMKRPVHAEPEICRASLAGPLLNIMKLGIKDLEAFGFMDAPPQKAVDQARDALVRLGALAPDGMRLTELGLRMSHFPLHPALSRMLLESEKFGCVEDMVTAVSFFGSHRIFALPHGKEKEARKAHGAFRESGSDALAFLNVFESYARSGYSAAWCSDHYLNGTVLQQVADTRAQLREMLKEDGIELSESHDKQALMRSVASGLIYNLFQLRDESEYDSVLIPYLSGVHIHPASGLAGAPPRWMVASDVIRTSKQFACNCTEVRSEWLPEFLPDRFSWGRIDLKSLSSDKRSIIGSRPILHKGKEIDCQEASVSFLEAEEIEAASVQEAMAKGWLKLSFHKLDDKWWRDSAQQVVTSASVDAGAEYYCERNFISPTIVTPKFRLFCQQKKKAEDRPSREAQAAKILEVLWRDD